MERCRNEGAGQTGDPRENPLTNGIVRHDSHLPKSSDPTKDEVRRSRWLRTTNHRVPTSNCFSANTSSENGMVWILAGERPRADRVTVQSDRSTPELHSESNLIPAAPVRADAIGGMFAARVTYATAPPACLPPRQTEFNPRPDHSRIFASGNRAGRCCWSAGFIEDLPFPPPLHSGAAPFSPHFTLTDSQYLVVKSRPNLSTLCFNEPFTLDTPALTLCSFHLSPSPPPVQQDSQRDNIAVCLHLSAPSLSQLRFRASTPLPPSLATHPLQLVVIPENPLVGGNPIRHCHNRSRQPSAVPGCVMRKPNTLVVSAGLRAPGFRSSATKDLLIVHSGEVIRDGASCLDIQDRVGIGHSLDLFRETMETRNQDGRTQIRTQVLPDASPKFNHCATSLGFSPSIRPLSSTSVTLRSLVAGFLPCGRARRVAAMNILGFIWLAALRNGLGEWVRPWWGFVAVYVWVWVQVSGYSSPAESGNPRASVSALGWIKRQRSNLEISIVSTKIGVVWT
ncbi:hypothetical protein PR048_030624 [Dryococelus australis]|uniref:Uncharacterized protein n=1 Tax=Dryococelus australis TaxID=614101 RepID=A0ABQ9G9F7_9NEOP|nr:hypothetical protein PR048_030624 [Dryococelus australis]